MTAKGAAAIGLFAALTAAAGWQFFRYRAEERAVATGISSTDSTCHSRTGGMWIP